MSIGCRIIKDFDRPAPELVARFKGMPVANIDDNMGRIAAVDAAIEPIGYKGQLLGTAFTVRVPQGDNLMFHAAMDLAKPGDVIVIDARRFHGPGHFRRTDGHLLQVPGDQRHRLRRRHPGPGRSGRPWRISMFTPGQRRPTGPIRTARARSTSPW